MDPDSLGVHQIANTQKPDRLADIVFIHGLSGASHSTWRHGKQGKPDHFFWPEELGKDLPDCGIWSVGYPADITKLGKPGMIIEKRAGNISRKLTNAGVGYRPLFFVTHSMGGLIVKSLVVDSQGLPNIDRKRLVDMVRGIVFCGTPHRGSALADAAIVLGKFFGGSQAHVKEMRADAVRLDILHEEFIEWHRKNPVPVDSYAETIGLFRERRILWSLSLGLVVPLLSADPGVQGYGICDVDDDHLTLVKPPSRQHDVYAGVLRFIRDAPPPAPPVPDPVKPDLSKEPQPDDWFLAHQYPMQPNFTGRNAEREMLTDWLNTDAAHPLLVLRALGGFGKSALAWKWLLHDVTAAVCPRVVWWCFYESDAGFDNFLADTLDYLGVKEAVRQSLSAHKQVEKLLNVLQQPGTLLVLDGFERALRAFGGLDAAYQGDDLSNSEDTDCDCISPLAELFLRGVATLPNLRSKILLTTQLCPRALEAQGGGHLQGCREEELLQMQPADAVAFFVAQGVRGARAEIEMACEPYGYHPLSLRLLAGLIVGDFQQPGDIAASKRLDVSGNLVQRKHHVLEVAYDSLTPERQALLGRTACFRGPVNYEAFKALAETAEESVATLDTDLRDLIARGLLHHDTGEGRFDLHPIVRRYAYRRLPGPDRAAAHTQLRDYFAAVPLPDNVTRLEDLAPVIELYFHTARAGQFDEACALFQDRLNEATYYQLGAYQLRIDLVRTLFPDGEDRPPRLKDESAQAWTLNELAKSYSLSGQPRRAVLLFEQVVALVDELDSKPDSAIALGNMATQQLVIGALRVAEANQHRRVTLCRDIKEVLSEAVGHEQLGRLLAHRGTYAESDAELSTALKMFENANIVQSQGIVWTYRAQRELFALRSNPESALRTAQSACESGRRALELADEDARTDSPVERDYIHAHWLLGAAHRVAGQPDDAERHLHEALERCRRINLVEMEADILIDLARLRVATAAPHEAQRLADEALLITERCGYVLQGADARLELAKLALARGDKTAAQDHAQKARGLATCDGPPDYTYKAAYDEAGALLTELAAGP